VFSNRLKSPLFLANNETKNELKQVYVDQSAPVKSITGDSKGYAIKRLIFKSANESELMKLVAADNNKG